MTVHIHPVPIPRAGPITDTALAHIRTIAINAQRHDTIDDIGAALLLLTLPQLIEELQLRRRIMANIHNVTHDRNLLIAHNG